MLCVVLFSTKQEFSEGALFGAGGLEQRSKSWYMLWFMQDPGPVEEALTANNWQLFRELFPVSAQQQELYIQELSKPGDKLAREDMLLDH